jgi:phosphatidylglycerophosphate synthase
MTYLDTVDGKLARVTVTSSKFGHLLDHILDLIHPPLWYLAWGLGLASYHPLLLPLGLGLTLWLIVAGYLAGRLVEGAFQLWLGQFGIFSWRKIDSYSRLVTARRNPCLVLLTLGSWLGRPDLGLEAVALWTALSSSFLVLRLAMAASERLSSGPLTSWLEEVEQDPSDRSLAVRWFARRPPRPIAGGPG